MSKSKPVPYCTCIGGTKFRHDYTLEETEYNVVDGLDICRYCDHVVIWLKPEDKVNYISKGRKGEAYYKLDNTVKQYMRGNDDN